MDPGTIITILQASNSVLGIIGKLYSAFYGHETSRSNLEELESRLLTLNRALQSSRKRGDAWTLAPDVSVPPTHLLKTIEECGSFLAEYEHAAGKAEAAKAKYGFKAKYQKVKLVLDADKLERLHRKLDRHVGDLLLHITASRDTGASGSEDGWPAEGGLAPPATQTPTIAPQQPERSLTALSGQTLSASEPQQLYPVPTSPHLQERRQTIGSLHQAATQAVSGLGITARPGVMFNEGWASEEQDATIFVPPRRVQSDAFLYTLPTPADSGASVVSSASSNRMSMSSISSATGSLNGEGIGKTVKLILPRETFVFTADNCTPFVTDNDARGVQWSNDDVTIWHYIPSNVAGIPVTRPDVKDLTFLPQGAKHSFSIQRTSRPNQFPSQPNPKPETRNEPPTYRFKSTADRTRFQELVRGASCLQTFRAVRILTKPAPGHGGHHGPVSSKQVARDVHVKVWSWGGTGATVSFVRNADNWRHNEAALGMFAKAFEREEESEARVVVRMKVLELADGGKRRDKDKGRKEEDSFRRRGSAISIASSAGGPEGWVSKIASLKVEFERAVGDKFCEAWSNAWVAAEPERELSTPQMISPEIMSPAPVPGLYHSPETVSPARLGSSWGYPSPLMLPDAAIREEPEGNIFELG